jgi:hypothetical protein
MRLGEYIRALVAALQACDRAAYDRLCHVVGTRVAHIELDDQAVWVSMRDGVLRVEEPNREDISVDGQGATDSETVRALLRGDLEVFEAILDDRLSIRGDIEQINRMFQAIGILLDVSPRCPAMQELSDQFVEESLSSEMAPAISMVNWYPFSVSAAEFILLTRFGLLP